MPRSLNVKATVNKDQNRRAFGLRIKRGLDELGDLDAPSKRVRAEPAPEASTESEQEPSVSVSEISEEEDSTPRMDVRPHVFERDWSDWREAKRAVFHPTSTPQDKKVFLSLSELWHRRVRADRFLPPYIEATELLVGAMLVDQSCTATTRLVVQSYGAALSRLVHVMTGAFAREGGLDTYRQRAKSIELPEEAVEVRQRVAHGNVPHITELRWVACMVLQYLFQTYWVAQEVEIQRMEREEAQKRHRKLRKQPQKVVLKAGDVRLASTAAPNGSHSGTEAALEQFSIDEMKRFLHSMDAPSSAGKREKDEVYANIAQQDEPINKGVDSEIEKSGNALGTSPITTDRYAGWEVL